MCFRFILKMLNYAADKQNLGKEICGKVRDSPSLPTLCLHKTIGVNELLLFHMCNYHGPLLVASPTSRSPQVAFPRRQLWHNCLPGCWLHLYLRGLHKYLLINSQNIKTDKLIFHMHTKAEWSGLNVQWESVRSLHFHASWVIWSHINCSKSTRTISDWIGSMSRLHFLLEIWMQMCSRKATWNDILKINQKAATADTWFIIIQIIYLETHSCQGSRTCCLVQLLSTLS